MYIFPVIRCGCVWAGASARQRLCVCVCVCLCVCVSVCLRLGRSQCVCLCVSVCLRLGRNQCPPEATGPLHGLRQQCTHTHTHTHTHTQGAFSSGFTLLVAGSVSLKQISILTASATRGTFYKQFAGRNENLGDITAKGDAQVYRSV